MSLLELIPRASRNNRMVAAGQQEWGGQRECGVSGTEGQRGYEWAILQVEREWRMNERHTNMAWHKGRCEGKVTE